MKVVVFSEKGGVGKSSIAHSLFLDLKVKGNKDTRFNYVTNDKTIITKIHDNAVKIDGAIPIKNNYVYDLGGFNTPFISPLLREADCLVIPVINHYDAILRCLDILEFLGDDINKVIVVANMIESESDFSEIRDPIIKRFNVGVYPLKKSKAFKRSLESGQSMNYICEENGLAKHSYRSVHKQYKKILKEIQSWQKQ